MPIRWKLKELADRRHLTGYEIAAMTRISKQTIYKLMREPVVTRLNEETVRKLCAALNVKRAKLLEIID